MKKSKPGRPRIVRSEQDVQFSIKMPPSLLRAIEAARGAELSRNAFIREILREKLLPATR